MVWPIFSRMTSKKYTYSEVEDTGEKEREIVKTLTNKHLSETCKLAKLRLLGLGIKSKGGFTVSAAKLFTGALPKLFRAPSEC